MQTSKVLLVLICLALVFGWASSLEAKKAKNEAPKWYLIDDQIDSPNYQKQIKGEALDAFLVSVGMGKSTDINNIQDSFTIAKFASSAAEECTSVALGLREEYVKAKAQTDAAKSGNVESSEVELSNAMQKKVEELKSKEAAMSDGQKTYLLSSIIYLAGAVVREKVLIESAKGYAEEAKQAKGLAAAKYAKGAPVAAGLVKDLPVMISAQTKLLGDYMAIAKVHGIEVPADVTKNMSGL